MLKFLRIPFATSGDKAAIGFPVDAGGAVSYSEGYTFDYQRAASDPAVKNIERDKMNGLFFDITTALRELQAQGVPDFITSALNGGTAYSYGSNAVVTYSGDLYLSLTNANTALPSDATKWALLPTPARIQTEAYVSDATVGGTANALTAELTPTVATLAGQAFRIRAAFANTTTTPTLNLDGTGALVIVKGNNQPLLAGDIPGPGAWLDIKHDATLNRYVLLNPFAQLPIDSFFTGSNQSLAGNGYQKLPGGFIMQWATGVSDASGNITITNPVAFTVGPIGGIANEAVPTGWGVSGTTVWAFDLGASTATTSIARERSVTGGSVAPAAGITGRILVWGK